MLKGDFAELRAIASRLNGFQFSRLTNVIGEESSNLFHQGFSAQRDPWGDAWSNESGKAPVNSVTGSLSVPALEIGAATIKLRMQKYWVFRQAGANGATPTALVPFGDIEKTLWARPMRNAAEGSIAKQLGAKP